MGFAHRLAAGDPVRQALDQGDRAVDAVQTAGEVQHQRPEDSAQEVARLGEALARRSERLGRVAIEQLRRTSARQNPNGSSTGSWAWWNR